MEYVSAGEISSNELSAIVTGVPFGLKISREGLVSDLLRGQKVYGAPKKSAQELKDVEITSGLCAGKTIGSPVSFTLKNADALDVCKSNEDEENSEEKSAEVQSNKAKNHKVQKHAFLPFLGTADLAAFVKTKTANLESIRQRAHANDNLVRIAAASIAKEFLAELGVEIFSYVAQIGKATLKEEDALSSAPEYTPLEIETSEVRCPCEKTTRAMKKEIDKARLSADSVGGVCRVVATGLVPGLGSYTQRNMSLASLLAGSLYSIEGVESLEFGCGKHFAHLLGSNAYDEITLDKKLGFIRKTNKSGGIDGGLTTGMPLIITLSIKAPLPPSRNFSTVNIDSLAEEEIALNKGCVCEVPQLAVVGESEVAFVLANAYMDLFGSTNMTDIKAAYKQYKTRLKKMAK